MPALYKPPETFCVSSGAGILWLPGERVLSVMGILLAKCVENARKVCLRLAGAFAKFQTAPLHRRHTFTITSTMVFGIVLLHSFPVPLSALGSCIPYSGRNLPAPFYRSICGTLFLGFP